MRPIRRNEPLTRLKRSSSTSDLRSADPALAVRVGLGTPTLDPTDGGLEGRSYPKVFVFPSLS
jgi:hypothetical protein